MVNEENQRIAERYRYRCYVTVLSTNTQWEAHLLNISESGALIAILEPHALLAGNELELLIEAEENGVINLVAEVMHVNEHYVGLRSEPRTQSDYARLTNTLKHIRANPSAPA